MHIDPLESRRLLSIALSDRVLIIEGTAGNDDIGVSLLAGTYSVHVNSEARKFAWSKVKSIVVNGANGDDLITFNDSYVSAYGRVSLSFDPTTPRNAVIKGGGGDDTLISGGGSDTLLGGKGRDHLQGRGGADEFFGGAGIDWIDYSDVSLRVNLDIDDVADDGIVVPSSPLPLGENEVDWPTIDNVHTDIENALGGSGDDDLTGSAAGNVLDGGGGNNFYRGLAGNDTMHGGLARDKFLGGRGIDTVDYSDRTLSIVVNIDTSGGDGQAFGTDDPAGENDEVGLDVEVVWGGSSDDLIAGYFNDDVLGENRYFDGGRGYDQLIGGTGNDTLVGGREPDRLSGGVGKNSDGTGSDGADVFIGGGRRQDLVTYEDRTDDVTITVDGLANDGAAGEGDFISDDLTVLIGGSGDDVIAAGPNSSTIIGNGGADTITGGIGWDWIIPAGDGVNDNGGNVIDGVNPPGGGFDRDTIINFESRDSVTNVEQAYIDGIVERYPATTDGNTGFILRRGPLVFTDIDVTGHISKVKLRLGMKFEYSGTIDTRDFAERGPTPVLVVDWPVS